MTVKVSLINMKGGVGKSTLCVNLGWHFAVYPQWAKRVLVVDLDPQFNASQYILGNAGYQELVKKGTPTVWSIFEQNSKSPAGAMGKLAPTDVVYPVWSSNKHLGRLDLIASQLELSYTLKNPTGKEKRLAALLGKIEADYDLILIDCAPTESLLTEAAYLSSDFLLVPVKPEYLSTIGLPLLANSLQEFKDENLNSQLKLAGIVFNATTEYLPEEGQSKKEVKGLAKKQGWDVLQHQVPYSRSFPKGAREGMPLFSTSYARGTKIKEFDKVVSEFAVKVGL